MLIAVSFLRKLWCEKYHFIDYVRTSMKETVLRNIRTVKKSNGSQKQSNKICYLILRDFVFNFSLKIRFLITKAQQYKTFNYQQRLCCRVFSTKKLGAKIILVQRLGSTVSRVKSFELFRVVQKFFFFLVVSKFSMVVVSSIICLENH